MKNTFPPQNNEELILNILNDTIIFDRLCEGVSSLFNLGRPEVFTIEENYKGLGTAIKLMGVEEDSLVRDLLVSTFLNYSTPSTNDSETASKLVFSQWEKLIRISNE
jgi:hypothetical protein